MNLSEVDLPCNAGRSQKHRLFLGTHNSKTVNRPRQGTPHEKSHSELTIHWSIFIEFNFALWKIYSHSCKFRPKFDSILLNEKFTRTLVNFDQNLIQFCSMKSYSHPCNFQLNQFWFNFYIILLLEIYKGASRYFERKIDFSWISCKSEDIYVD